MNQPTASVIIPALNAAETIGVQLEALARQVDAPAFEVLVCDNGSTDATAAACGDFEARLDLHVIDASLTRGPSAARNAGAAAARGSLLLFCDADDMVGENWVSALTSALATSELAAGPWGLSHFNAMYSAAPAFTPATFTLTAMPGLRAAGAGNLGVRKDAFARLGGFAEAMRVGEDIDLCWRAQLLGFSLGEAPDGVVEVRRPSGPVGAWRQAFAYGRAERQLARRYALISLPDSFDDGPAEQADPLPQGERAGLISRLAGLRRPFAIHHAAQKYGQRLGARCGRVDASLEQLKPTREAPSTRTQPERRESQGVPSRVAASVIIPAYNAAATLGEQLDALERQVAAPPFEVLVCDNGSTDATAEIVAARAGGTLDIRLVDASAVRGASAARNTGAGAALGWLVLFCDADDVVADDWVGSLSAAAVDHAVVTGGWDFSRINAFYGHTGPGHAPLFELAYLPGFVANGGGNLGVRRDVFAEVGGFDERLRAGEDADLCIRLQLAGYEIHPCPEAIVHVRLKQSLRDSARQAFAWGRSDRELRRKFAAVAVEPPSTPWTSTFRAFARGTVALRHRAGRLDASAEIGRWFGAHFARTSAAPHDAPVPS